MQEQHMYNSQIMDIINEDTLYNRLTKHIKETIIIITTDATQPRLEQGRPRAETDLKRCSKIAA